MPATPEAITEETAEETTGEIRDEATDETLALPAAAEHPGKNDAGVARARGQRSRAPRTRPAVSQAVIKMPVELRSRQAQRVFRRSYNVAARALYTLSVMLRIYADEVEAEQVNQVAEQMLSTVRAEMQAEIARMEKVATDQSIDTGAIAYTVAQTFEAAVTSPRATEYLGLIGQMDRFVQYMDLLWLSGIYTNPQYHAGIYQWQRRLIKLANRLRNLSQRAMALSRRDDDDSRASLAQALLGEGGSDDESTDEDDEADDATEADDNDDGDANTTGAL